VFPSSRVFYLGKASIPVLDPLWIALV